MRIVTNGSKCPKYQERVLRYMRAIAPVAKTLSDLIKALRISSEGTNLKDLPQSVLGNKAFDGHYEATNLKELVTEKTLYLKVQVGYRELWSGDLLEVLDKHLEMSDRFHIEVLPPKRNRNRGGMEFTILRDGTLYPGVSSSSTTW